MGLGRVCMIATVGIGLPLAGVAAPAEAAATAPPQQCQNLLGCVVPIVSGLTVTVTGLVPTVVNTTVPSLVSAVPKLLTTVPQVLSGVLAPPPTKPTQPPNVTPPPPPRHHGKPTVTTHHHATTTAPPVRTTAVTPTIQPSVPTPQVTQPTPQKPTNPVVQVLQEAAHVAAQVVTLLGWNLLALIPMAGIAFVISRRMATAKRSASGLL